MSAQPDTSSSADVAAPPFISADEIALYDRQIRLWGVDAQTKIRNAKIFLVSVKGLGSEVAKNLVLAGIGSLTLFDNGVVSEEDLASQFFTTDADIGRARAEAALPAIQRLNPRVSVVAENRDLLTLDPAYFSAFDVIIATDLSITAFSTLNAASRLSNRPFYAAGCHGLYGFIFADLIEHTYIVTRTSSASEPGSVPLDAKPGTQETATRTIISTATQPGDNGTYTDVITKRETYQPMILANTSPLSSDYLSSRRRLKQVTPLLPCLRALWEFEKSLGRPVGHSVDDLKLFTKLATEKSAELQLPPETLKSDFLRSFMQNLGAELAPACAFIGGHLAQDVINVIGGKGQPIQNMVLFDGDASLAPVYALTPIVTTMDASL